MPDSEDSERAAAVDVSLENWVEAAANDPLLYRDPQVVEILLPAIGLSPTLKGHLVLKGGPLMALAFDSPRLTSDVDFGAEADPATFEKPLVEELNLLLPRAAVRLGYLDLICSVQSLKHMPRPLNFADHDFPALEVRIASAVRGTNEEARLAEGQAPSVVELDISFRDPVHTVQALRLGDTGLAVRAFTLHELIAEKFRALLQQPIRNRYRRQDVYDIAHIVDTQPMTAADRRVIHATLIKKCATRNIRPDRHSLEADEVVRRAERDWNTLKLELAVLPPFADRFALVAALYRALPWDEGEPPPS